MNYENILYAIALSGGSGGGGGGDVEQIIAEVMERVAADYYNKVQTDAIVSAIETGKIIIVDELPATGGPKDIYFIPRPAPLKGYNEWMYISGEWEEIGDTTIDLSNYYNKQEIDAMMSVVPTQADVDAIYRQIGSVETKADDAKYVAQQAQQEAALAEGHAQSLETSKQDVLVPGDHITINGGVIDTTGLATEQSLNDALDYTANIQTMGSTVKIVNNTGNPYMTLSHNSEGEGQAVDFYAYDDTGEQIIETSIPTTALLYSNYYNKTAVDALLADKADATSVYTKTETDTLLAGKQNTLTKADILALLGYEEITISIKDENDNVVTKKILAEVENNG